MRLNVIAYRRLAEGAVMATYRYATDSACPAAAAISADADKRYVDLQRQAAEMRRRTDDSWRRYAEEEQDREHAATMRARPPQRYS